MLCGAVMKLLMHAEDFE